MYQPPKHDASVGGCELQVRVGVVCKEAEKTEHASFMEFSIAFGRASEGTSMPDQDEIAAYEGLLKSIPQIQVVFTDNVSSSWSSFCVLMSVCLFFLFLIMNPLCSSEAIYLDK